MCLFLRSNFLLIYKKRYNYSNIYDKANDLSSALVKSSLKQSVSHMTKSINNNYGTYQKSVSRLNDKGQFDSEVTK